MNRLDQFDLLFSMRLEHWTFVRRGLRALFSRAEIDTLRRSERAFRRGERVVVLLAFENRFASLGGLTPVMKYLPDALKRLGERVIFMSPFHAGNQAMRSALAEGLLKPCFDSVEFHLCEYTSTCACWLDASAGLPSYYLQIPDRFAAGDNPYAYPDPESLLMDTLAFAAAVPFALGKLGLTDTVVLHAHEWETALAAVTSKMAVVSGVLQQARTVLTLHNSFDSPFPASLKKKYFGKDFPGDTVLQSSVPFCDGPLSTVSSPFALELRSDPLQHTVFTDHLQDIFSINAPIGIENGIFGNAVPPFSAAILKQAAAGTLDPLLSRKRTYTRRFLKGLGRVRDPRITGRLRCTEGDFRTPVFFMAGRLDFMQKGFDIMFRAFERLKRGSAKLFFCPSSAPGGGTPEELAFFTEIAERCEGDIEIWPFKIPRRLYTLFLKGSSFLLMPSLYEPFGSANEGLMNGTPVVARATGGLWLQVNSAARIRVPTFYGGLKLDGEEERPTGILFREEYPDDAAGKEWRRLLELPAEKRGEVPLCEALVRAARRALEQAIECHGRPETYGTMILNGLGEVGKFSWERAAQKYRCVYDVAATRQV